MGILKFTVLSLQGWAPEPESEAHITTSHRRKYGLKGFQKGLGFRV